MQCNLICKFYRIWREVLTDYTHVCIIHGVYICHKYGVYVNNLYYKGGFRGFF